MKEVFMVTLENIYLYTNMENMVVIEIEHNTAEIQKRITVKKGDINMSEDIFKFMEVVRMAIVNVVRTVFNEMKHNKEEFAVQKGDINMIEDTNMGIVVDFKSVEVVGTVIFVEENIMIEVYVMRKKEQLTVQEGTSTSLRPST